MRFIKNAFWTVAVLLNIASWLVFALAFVLPGEGGPSADVMIQMAIAMSVMPVMAAIAVEKAR